MKKKIALLLTLSLGIASLSGCKTQQEVSDKPSFKIGIMTGTVAQGEEEYRAAEAMKKKYGNRIETVTYPDNFVKEQETTISNMMQLASDPDVKAIIMCIGITGASAAFEKVRETRPDILLICGNTVEDPDMIAEKVDLVIHPDEVNMGNTIPEQAQALGAKTMVHYSFPRHMSSALYKARKELMAEQCEKRGITFVEETCPDPMGDLGIPGAQMFILEDIPRKVSTYGKDTCFFNTNCSMQEPLIQAAVKSGAIVAQQCCPSPFHGYPGALGIAVNSEKLGDSQAMIDAIREKMAEKGVSGRFSTWEVPVNMTIIQGAVDYAMKYCNGETNGKNDGDALAESLNQIAGEGNVSVSHYKSLMTGKEVENMYMILEKYVTF